MWRGFGFLGPRKWLKILTVRLTITVGWPGCQTPVMPERVMLAELVSIGSTRWSKFVA